MPTWNNMTSTTKATLAIVGVAGTILTTAFSYGTMTGVYANENALTQVKSELSQRVSDAGVKHAVYDSTLSKYGTDIRRTQDDMIAVKKDTEYMIRILTRLENKIDGRK